MELELIIKRLNRDLRLNKEEIIKWMNESRVRFNHCTALQYVDLNLARIVLNYIDELKENKHIG